MWRAQEKQRSVSSLRRNENLILACSALRNRYRERLRVDPARVHFVHLRGSPELLSERLSHRAGHFMKPGMLTSQLASLENPADAFTLDVGQKPEELAAAIRHHFSL